MASVKNVSPWAAVLRSQVRALCSGWTVRESRGRVCLVVRETGRQFESLTLDLPWREDVAADAYVRIRNIYMHWHAGSVLRESFDIASGKAPNTKLDWQGAAKRFQIQKMEHGPAIKQITWDASYADAVGAAVALMLSRKPPRNVADLMDSCVSQWPPGARRRQMQAHALAQFLRHCVTREHFPDGWAPPADLAGHVGRKLPVTQKGDPVPDPRILRLVAHLPRDDAGQRWTAAVMLLAELGLRPIELLHLSVKVDPMTGEPYWWCSYMKRSGGGSTAARRVYPLALAGEDGSSSEWNLLSRWQAGRLELPPLTYGAGDGLGTYLKRQGAWSELRDEMATTGERLVPYSLRHSYSLRGHRLGIDAGSMARSMGHSYEVHCRSYPWASEANTAAAFAKVRKAA